MDEYEWPTEAGFYPSDGFTPVEFRRVEIECRDTLYQCPLCFALVDTWSDEKHKAWHDSIRH